MHPLGQAVKVWSGGPVTVLLLGETLLQGTQVARWSAMAAPVARQAALVRSVVQPVAMVVAPLMGMAFEKATTSLLRPCTTSVPCVRPLIAAPSGLLFAVPLGPKARRPLLLARCMVPL